MRSVGNLILMTLICVIVFIVARYSVAAALAVAALLVTIIGLAYGPLA